MKRFEDFKEFYNFADNLVQKINEATNKLSAPNKVLYARNSIEKQILISYIDIAIISNEVQNELNSNSQTLKFSVDNLIKNRIAHSDVLFEDYLKIPLIAQNPSKIIKSKNGYDVMLFKSGEKYYKLVIKTTKNHNENYIKSFHLLKQNRYDKY